MGRISRVDAAIVAVLVAVGQFDVWVVSEDLRGSHALNAAWIAATAVPLLWRRTNPVATFVAIVIVVSGGAHALYGWTSQPTIEPWIALLIALYSVAAYADGRRAAIAIGASVVPALALDAIATAKGAEAGETWPAWGFYVLAVALGRGLRRRRLLTEALAERTVQLEQERERHARIAVIEERARIARELHDVIAHHVSGVVVQAAVERRALGDERPETAAVLGDIENAGRESLLELRRLLGVLRHGEEPPALEPQPGLADIDRLVDHARESGVRVAVRVEGEAAALPAGLDLTAFRIVQEALTNTVKHAHATSAEVTLRYGPRDVTVEVVDDGHATNNGATSVPGGGLGLVGMRERTELYGGELRMGPRPAGGFGVRARFPRDPVGA